MSTETISAPISITSGAAISSTGSTSAAITSSATVTLVPATPTHTASFATA
ncbi:hypothetical protein MHY85_03045 [Cellulomonas sp. ACRRI]|uniref:hypothetical protein n=1 Tax=Cellulomonas sp. ACRRI TaxID=2918188 RepID=UPI001EF32D77|nr:hypothetical protein [Cellulomonas sp. ACRRI]MCG7284948.1 hypothetical protein [Cellulomonas sp. ACRRI]